MPFSCPFGTDVHFSHVMLAMSICSNKDKDCSCALAAFGGTLKTKDHSKDRSKYKAKGLSNSVVDASPSAAASLLAILPALD